jgi:hypothetical protein
MSLLAAGNILFNLWYSYTLTGVIPGYGGSTFHWFVIPHLVLMPLALAAVILDIFFPSKATLTAVVVCFSGPMLTWFFAGQLWPHSDETNGTAWMYTVGFVSPLCTGVGLPAAYFGHTRREIAANRGR